MAAENGSGLGLFNKKRSLLNKDRLKRLKKAESGLALSGEPIETFWDEKLQEEASKMLKNFKLKKFFKMPIFSLSKAPSPKLGA